MIQAEWPIQTGCECLIVRCSIILRVEILDVIASEFQARNEVTVSVAQFSHLNFWLDV